VTRIRVIALNEEGGSNKTTSVCYLITRHEITPRDRQYHMKDCERATCSDCGRLIVVYRSRHWSIVAKELAASS